MTTRQEYSADTFFGRYESLVRGEVGDKLDDLYKLLRGISNECQLKIFNLPIGKERLTVNELLRADGQLRRRVLSALLYDDALWRIEAAYLMLCIGLLAIAYANLRTSKEALVTAFIVERVDSEAIAFLKHKDVNQKLIKNLIRPEYNGWLLDMQKAFSDWGIHTRFKSLQLTNLYGP